MPTPEQIATALALSDAYFLELLAEYYIDDQNGCIECCDNQQLLCLMAISKQLTTQAEAGIYDAVTNTLYDLLLKAIEAYPGVSLAVDPNAQIPGTTIIVENSGMQPFPLTFEGSDIDPSGFIDLSGTDLPAGSIYINGYINGTEVSLQYDMNNEVMNGFSGSESPSDVILLQFIYPVS